MDGLLGSVTLHWDQILLLVCAIALGVSLAWMWRESVKDARQKVKDDALHQKNRELQARVDDLETRLTRALQDLANMREKYYEIMEHLRRSSNLTINAAGDATIGGDAVGRDSTR